MDIFQFTLEELENWLLANNEKKFRAKQIFTWLYQKEKISFDEMSNLSLSLRERLQNHFNFFSLKLVEETSSSDQETIKYLWELPDGSLIESVLISSGDRRTLCVSSQVGCPGRCAFCASGKLGFIKNLEVSEIIQQIVFIDNLLKQKKEKLSHIVFMGMGEPLANYETLTKVLKILTCKEGLHFSQRRITVSTVGIPEKIVALANNGFRVNIALSLHEVDQESREKIIPFAKKYSLKELFDALSIYATKTKRDITYEYILIAGVNDSIKKAKQLCSLLKNMQCCINLIPYNPIDQSSFKRPSNDAIEAFEKILLSSGICVTRRYTKGKDIAAACGQLAMKKMDP